MPIKTEDITKAFLEEEFGINIEFEGAQTIETPSGNRYIELSKLLEMYEEFKKQNQ